ncbi:MAG: alkaline phosphatase family protein [Nocardioides sp.]
MRRSRLTRLSSLTALVATPVLGVALAAPAPALTPASAGRAAAVAPASIAEAAPKATAITRVLLISVDGLNPTAIKDLGRSQAPTFYRLIDEGATTLNARTEYEQTETLPNHTGMVTGRRITASRGGHGVTWNDDRLTPARSRRPPGTRSPRSSGSCTRRAGPPPAS